MCRGSRTETKENQLLNLYVCWSFFSCYKAVNVIEIKRILFIMNLPVHPPTNPSIHLATHSSFSLFYLLVLEENSAPETGISMFAAG